MELADFGLAPKKGTFGFRVLVFGVTRDRLCSGRRC